MKKTLLLLSLALASVGGWAAEESYQSLVFQQTDGTTVSVTAVGTVIMFSGDNAVITTPTGSQTLPLSMLNSMYFSSEAPTTGISGVESDNGNSTATEIYTMGGVRVDKMDRPGVYIVKKNGKTYKQVVR